MNQSHGDAVTDSVAIEGLAYMNDKLYLTALSSSSSPPHIGSIDLTADTPTITVIVPLTSVDSPRAIVGHACSGYFHHIHTPHTNKAHSSFEL